jgi:hypothetical protein
MRRCDGQDPLTSLKYGMVPDAAQLTWEPRVMFLLSGRGAMRWIVMALPLILLVILLVVVVILSIALPKARCENARQCRELVAGLIRDLAGGDG